jgi:hypothetical protein
VLFTGLVMMPIVGMNSAWGGGLFNETCCDSMIAGRFVVRVHIRPVHGSMPLRENRLPIIHKSLQSKGPV